MAGSQKFHFLLLRTQSHSPTLTAEGLETGATVCAGRLALCWILPRHGSFLLRPVNKGVIWRGSRRKGAEDRVGL